MEPTELFPSLMTQKTSEPLVLGILLKGGSIHSPSLGTYSMYEREAVIEMCSLSSSEKTDLPLEKKGKAETCPGCWDRWEGLTQ